MIPTPILDELQALLESATRVQPGPFRFSPWHIEEGEAAVKDRSNCYVCTTASDAQSECIAALLNHAPALMAAARQLEEVRRDAERSRPDVCEDDKRTIKISDEMWHRLFELCGTAWLSDGHQELVIDSLLNIAIPIQGQKQEGILNDR